MTPQEMLVQQILGRALELCVEQGADDKTITVEFVKIGLALVGNARGGPHMIAPWLEAVAAEMRTNPAAMPTIN